MPTAATRTYTQPLPKKKTGPTSNGTLNSVGLHSMGLHPASSRSSVSEIKIEFNPNACPAPPCQQSFWWAPIPKRITKRAKKTVTPPSKHDEYKNIMFDRHVIRGTTHAPGKLNLLANFDPFNKADEIRRSRALKKKAHNRRNVLGTPPPVAGRQHGAMQTDKYLEIIDSQPTNITVDTQTDLFLSRPPIPPLIPEKVGKDVATEIGEGELFHFDAEAQPIIDTLVDATLEQTMLEVAHEKELEVLRQKQEEFLAKREIELAKLRRLEAEEMRLQAEKNRRLRQDAITKDLNEEMQKGIAAAKLLQGHFAGLLPEVLDNLEPASDAVKKEKLMKTVCPWLATEVSKEVTHIADSRLILAAIIQDIIKERAAIYSGYVEEVPEEMEPAFSNEEEQEEFCACPPECLSETKSEEEECATNVN